jgi:hypothetical protein
MTIYYQHNGWGDYVLNVQEDRKPFSDGWLERQKQATGRLEPSEGPPSPEEAETDSTDLLEAAERRKNVDRN